MIRSSQKLFCTALAIALMAGTGFCEEDTGRGEEDERLVLGEEDLAERGEIARNMFRRIMPGDEPLVQDVGTWPVAWEEFAPNWAAPAVGREYGAWVVPFSLAQESGATVIRDANDTVLWRGETDFAKPESASVTLVGGLVAEEDWAAYEGVRNWVETNARLDDSPSRGATYTNGLRFTSVEIGTHGTLELSLAWEEDGDVDIFAYLLSGIPSTNVVTWTNDENQVVTTTNTVWEIIGENLSGFDNDWEWRGMASVTNGEGIFTDSGAAANPVRMGFYAAAEANDTDGDGLNDGFESFVHHTDPMSEDTDGDGWCDAAELSAGFDPLDAASFPRVVIQAVRYKLPTGETSGEWIELYSASIRPVDLSGAELAIGRGPDWDEVVTFAPGTIIQPGRCLLVGDGAVTNADVTVASLDIPDSGPHLDMTGVRLAWFIQDTITVGDTVFIGGRETPFNDLGLDPTGWNSTGSVWCAAGSIVERRYAGIDTDTVGDWTWNTNRPGRNASVFVDSDGDGLSDGEEWTGSRNPYGEPTDPWNADSDGDGLDDCAECMTNRTNPNAWSTMGDIWPWAPTNGPAVATNWPGSDSWKILHGIDPTNAVVTTNGFPVFWEMLLEGPGSFTPGADSDGDGVDNATEIIQNSNPHDPTDSEPNPFVAWFEFSRPDWKNGVTNNDIGLYGRVWIHFRAATPGANVCVRVSEGNMPEEFGVRWMNAEETACAEGETPQTWYTSAVLSEHSVLEISDLGRHSNYTNTLGGEFIINIFATAIVPDWNHDRAIDDGDRSAISIDNPFRFWVNDDNDNAPFGDDDSDIPYYWTTLFGNADCHNGAVDGECDLLDFFPVWIDVAEFLDSLPSESVACRLRQDDGAVNAVYTDLTNASAGLFLTGTNLLYGAELDQPPQRAPVLEITGSGVELSTGFVGRVRAGTGTGVLLLEGSGRTEKPLVFEVWLDGRKISATQMPLSISSVEDMYRWINLRPSGDPPTKLGEPSNYPDHLCSGKNVFFLHGFNVNANEARAWNAEIFKRLYQSGSRARFWGVAWEGDIGMFNGLNYHEDVTNAFATAAAFRDALSNVVGEKIVLAHSLGNMVVSEAIQSNGLVVDKYFMLNAAVPSESYDAAAFKASPANNLVPAEWGDYTNVTWAAMWHELFPTNDDRSCLTWRGRFADVANVAYNYYSSQDEIFELKPGGAGPFSGGLLNLERYAWQKQEMLKGTGYIGGTTWAGWGMRYANPTSSVPLYTAAEANTIAETNKWHFCETPLFWLSPDFMFSASITADHRNEILGRGIPAQSEAMGRFKEEEGHEIMPQLDLATQISRTNGWGRNDSVYGTRWLHGDIKTMAYLYIHELFDRLVSAGDLN